MPICHAFTLKKVRCKRYINDGILCSSHRNYFRKFEKLTNDELDKYFLKRKDEMNTLILVAVRHDADKLVEYLIESGVDKNTRDYCNYPVLVLAVKNDAFKTIKLLIEKCVDLNVQEYEGQTALMTAVKSGKFETVKLLVEAGADLNVQKDDGRTALMIAVMNSKK